MFTLWYAHLLYKEYRSFFGKLYERRPHAIEALHEDPSTVDETNLETDQNSLLISQVRCCKPPNFLRPESSSIISENLSDDDLSSDEDSFQPLATSSPFPRSASNSPVILEEPGYVSIPQISNHDAGVAEDESDPNRTPSFSEMVAGDPMLVIPAQQNENAQPDTASATPEGSKNTSQKLLEAEKISNIGITSETVKSPNEENYVVEDEEDIEEDESDVEDDEEEENSVISSPHVTFRPNVTSPLGSSIEIINHELNGEDE